MRASSRKLSVRFAYANACESEFELCGLDDLERCVYFCAFQSFLHLPTPRVGVQCIRPFIAFAQLSVLELVHVETARVHWCRHERGLTVMVVMLVIEVMVVVRWHRRLHQTRMRLRRVWAGLATAACRSGWAGRRNSYAVLLLRFRRCNLAFVRRIAMNLCEWGGMATRRVRGQLEELQESE